MERIKLRLIIRMRFEIFPKMDSLHHFSYLLLFVQWHLSQESHQKMVSQYSLHLDRLTLYSSDVVFQSSHLQRQQIRVIQSHLTWRLQMLVPKDIVIYRMSSLELEILVVIVESNRMPFQLSPFYQEKGRNLK